MTSLYIHGGGLLVADGALASSSDCCCGDEPPATPCFAALSRCECNESGPPAVIIPCNEIDILNATPRAAMTPLGCYELPPFATSTTQPPGTLTSVLAEFPTCYDCCNPPIDSCVGGSCGSCPEVLMLNLTGFGYFSQACANIPDSADLCCLGPNNASIPLTRFAPNACDWRVYGSTPPGQVVCKLTVPCADSGYCDIGIEEAYIRCQFIPQVGQTAWILAVVFRASAVGFGPAPPDECFIPPECPTPQPTGSCGSATLNYWAAFTGTCPPSSGWSRLSTTNCAMVGAITVS
jgi:hypothetical protein